MVEQFKIITQNGKGKYEVARTGPEKLPVYWVLTPKGDALPTGYARQSDAKRAADKFNGGY